MRRDLEVRSLPRHRPCPRLDEIADLAIRGLRQEDLDGRRVLLHGGRFVDRLADQDVLARGVPSEVDDPVATPVRFTSRTAQTRSSSSLSIAGALALRRRLDRADRVVLVAEREPKTATIASPMIFSMLPPCDSRPHASR